MIALPVPKSVKRLLSWDKKGFVLCYHRVAALDHDPWELAVTHTQFQDHLQFLGDNFDIVSLRQLKDEDGRKRRRPLCSITFDDGYLDNSSVALPIIERFRVPVTVFITTAVLDDKPFWWDELSRIIFEPTYLPAKLDIVINSERLVSNLKFRAENPEPGDAAFSTRSDLYFLLWNKLYLMDDYAKFSTLSHLSKWAAVGENTGGAYSKLSSADTIRLSKSPFVEIGSHAVNHNPMEYLSRAKCETEMINSKRRLEDLLQAEVRLFSYPHGSCNALTFDCVRAAGYEAAVTTQAKWYEDSDSVFQIPRITVGSWDVEDLEVCLRQHGILMA